MSAKWIRSRRWDDEHLTGLKTPLRWALRAFSSITLAVVLLSMVALYGALASIPIGLFALIPTQILYAVILLVSGLVVLGLPLRFVHRAAQRSQEPSRSFVIDVVVSLLLLGVWYWLWTGMIWPALRHVPADPLRDLPSTGLRLFEGFVAEHRSTVLRQLPSWEMTELEFYGWWPFKLILILFVVNMVVATIRRIEFKWLNVGVLTVHTGIVLIALGSVTYARAKVEGDMILIRDAPTPTGDFYDNISTALYVWPEGSENWYRTVLSGIPRYNNAPPGSKYAPNYSLNDDDDFQQLFSADLEVGVRGCIPYGLPTWRYREGGRRWNPSVQASLLADRGGRSGIVWSDRLVSSSPAAASVHDETWTLQLLVAPTPMRLADLTAEFSTPAEHFLIIRIPGDSTDYRYAVAPDDVITVGETGWTLRIRRVQASNAGLAIITPGYEGSASSRIIVEASGPNGRNFDRHVLYRYPELTQDFSPAAPGAPPRRTPPDPSVEITYIDATKTHFILVQPDPHLPSLRLIRRDRRGRVTVTEDLVIGRPLTGPSLDGDSFRFMFEDMWTHTTTTIASVTPVADSDQDRDLRGTLAHAYLNVEIQARLPDGQMWTHREWLPFLQYTEARLNREEDLPFVRVPGHGGINFAFGRLRRSLPGVALRLVDFAMTPYPGTDIPRDYASTLAVHIAGQQEIAQYVTRLNRPYVYRVPFRPRPERGALGNLLGRVRHFIIPDQYKFSQSGWDPERQNFTILGVGNNPGIYIVATGGILMGIGIPWAFYVKPALLKAKKRRIQRLRAEQEKSGSSTNTAERTPRRRRTSDMWAQPEKVEVG